MGRLTVVAPVFNEVANLAEFYLRMSAMAAGLDGWSVELLLVDDGSTDGSGEVIRSWMIDDPTVRLISLSRNFGHQTALTCGLDHADGDVVVTMDSDLQDPPELIPSLLQAWRSGSMVVYARRRSRSSESLFKRWSAHAFYRLVNHLSEVPLPVDVGDFRLLDRQVVAQLRQLRETNRYLRGMVAWVGFRQDYVDYDRDGRTGGETHYPLRSMLRLATDAVTGFSQAPLRLVRRLGFLLTGLAFLVLGYVVASKIAHPHASVPGYTTLLATVCLAGGMQMLCLGILGDYLGRLYVQAKGRPLYVVGADSRGFPVAEIPATQIPATQIPATEIPAQTRPRSWEAA